MEFFWFIVIQFSFIALVAFSVQYASVSRKKHQSSPSPPFSQDRNADWMVWLHPRTESGIFARNLKTNEQVIFPSPREDEISVAWIVALFSATVALGCLAGYILYKIWGVILHSWF